MPTYDYTGDSDAGAAVPAEAKEHFVVYKRRVSAPLVIASNTTLTAAAKIAANDIIQIIDVADNFVALGSAILTVTPEGAAETFDLGIAGGDELQDGASSNNTAGEATLTLVADDWGPNNLTGYHFSAGDTIDLTFKNDTTTGVWDVYVWGVELW